MEAPGCNEIVTKLMTVGELVLETLSTGVITEDEVTWLTDHLQTFTRPEEAAAIRLGRLMDEGQVNLGCRVSKRWLHHREVLVDWIEPLGRHSWSVLSVATRMPLLLAKFSDSSILRSARLSRSLIAKPHTNFWFISNTAFELFLSFKGYVFFTHFWSGMMTFLWFANKLMIF